MTKEECEFVGFFKGDGSIIIGKVKMKTTKGIRANYLPIMKIELRADSLPLLKWIKEKIGGYVHHKTSQRKQKLIKNPNGKTYIQNPTARWVVASRKDCLHVISLLEQSKMPSQKDEQVKVMRKFLEIKKRGRRHGFQGEWFTDKELEQQEKLRQKISSIKIFRECNNKL